MPTQSTGLPRWRSVALLFIALCAGNTWASACFDDKKLAQLQAASTAQRGTLIYVWSPRMVYSVQNMATASRAAAVAGLDFVVVRDGTAAPAEADLAVWPHGPQAGYRSSAEPHPPVDLATPPFVPPQDFSQVLCSLRLIALDAQRHFPTAFVVNSSQIHRFPIVGAMPYEAWASSIAQRLIETSSAQ